MAESNDPAREIPRHIYGFMLAATVAHEADLMLQARDRRHRDDVLMPANHFGDLLGWLWREGNRGEVCMILADLLAELRNHNPKADPTITLEELLSGVRLSLDRLGSEPTAELLAAAREDVPGLYGSNPT